MHPSAGLPSKHRRPSTSQHGQSASQSGSQSHSSSRGAAVGMRDMHFAHPSTAPSSPTRGGHQRAFAYPPPPTGHDLMSIFPTRSPSESEAILHASTSLNSPPQHHVNYDPGSPLPPPPNVNVAALSALSGGPTSRFFAQEERSYFSRREHVPGHSPSSSGSSLGRSRSGSGSYAHGAAAAGIPHSSSAHYPNAHAGAHIPRPASAHPTAYGPGAGSRVRTSSTVAAASAGMSSNHGMPSYGAPHPAQVAMEERRRSGKHTKRVPVSRG